jgi:hypothetical protein
VATTTGRWIGVAVGIAAALGALAAAALVGLVGLSWLAASFSDGLFPTADLLDVSREQALELGYIVPTGAAHVHVRDRAVMDVRSTWFRFDLPEEERAALVTQAGLGGAHAASHPAVPAEWPTFATFASEDFVAPAWWAPSAGSPVWLRTLKATPTEDYGSGTYIVLDSGHVFVWTWSHQWWGIGGS